VEGYGQLQDKLVSIFVALPTADFNYGVRSSPLEPSFANSGIQFYVTANLNLSTHGNSASSAHRDPYLLGNSYVDCVLRSKLSLRCVYYWGTSHFI
jgi:hypothetical protein